MHTEKNALGGGEQKAENDVKGVEKGCFVCRAFRMGGWDPLCNIKLSEIILGTWLEDSCLKSRPNIAGIFSSLHAPQSEYFKLQQICKHVLFALVIYIFNLVQQETPGGG